MNAFPLFIHGHGAVSTAGVGSEVLHRAVADGRDIAVQEMRIETSNKTLTYRHRPVDRTPLKSVLPKHPRLRRASDVTKFGLIATQEAIGEDRMEKIRSRKLRVGIVMTFMNGCVNYSNRFFGEVLQDPTLASPILFPETVFNAPAGHIATFLECDGPVYTLIGDSAAWFSAFGVAEEWIAADLVDGCLILSAEEIDRLTLEGLGFYSRDLIATEGAAAIYVEANRSPIAIQSLHGPFDYTDANERRTAIREACDAVKQNSPALWVDGLTGIHRMDHDEAKAAADFTGPRLSPSKILGEGMGVRCGFQTIAAIGALQDGAPSAAILASGGNQHAYAASLHGYSL